MQQQDAIVAVDRWREELLTKVLRSVFALGVLAGIPTVVFAIEAARFDIVVVDVVGLIVVGTVTFVTAPAYRLRVTVLLLAIYVLGLFLLVTVGSVGQLYLVALPVMAAILLGMRGAVAGLLVNATTLTIVGVVAAGDPRGTIQGFDGWTEWAVVSINLLFVNAVMAVTCALLLRRIERSLADEQQLSASLATEREALDARNRALEREAVERRAAEDRQRFQSQLLEAVGEAVVAVDLDGLVRFVNPAAERLYGWEEHQPVGRRFAEVVDGQAPAAEVDDMLRRMRRGETWVRELDITRHDGTTFPALVTNAPYDDAAGRAAGTIGVAADITELRGSIDRLARSEQIRLAFLRATSHELRTPLTAIVGFIETVRRRDGDLEPAERAHLIDRVAVNTRRLHGLITDLLDVDRLSSGLVSANRQPHDLAALVLRALEEVELTDRDVGTDLEAMVVAVDAPKIERVVINLVANAARHGGPGGAVWVRLARDADTTVLQVSDDGPGIAPDYLEQIFEPFVQGPERHHDAKPGTGLGLSLARELVRLHGGEISATNQSPNGACFEVRIPDQDEDSDSWDESGS